jgi:hypothetical protein
MSPTGFETAIPASERPQTCTLERAATETAEMPKYYSEKKIRKHLRNYRTVIQTALGLPELSRRP